MKRIHWLLLLLGMVVLVAVVSRDNQRGGTVEGVGRSAVTDMAGAPKPYIFNASEQQISAVVGGENAARVVAVLESMERERINWSIIRKTADIDDRALADLRNAFSLDPPAPVDAENNAARYSYDTTSEWIISPQVVDTSTILTKSNVAYTTIRRSWTEGNACIEIRYPSFGNLALDRTLENKVMAEVERFRGMVHEYNANDMGFHDTYPMYYLVMDFEIKLLNANVVSLLYPVSTSSNYHAHPSPSTLSVIADRNTGKQITLDDIFAPGTYYLNALGVHTIPQMLRHYGGVDYNGNIRSGCAPKPENFSVFYLQPHSLAFHFDNYQMASYACGPADSWRCPCRC